MSKASDILGLTDESHFEEVRLRWRELANIHHPDKGGDPTKFDELRKAYRQLMRELEAPRPCKGCKGTGKILINRGVASVHMLCQWCVGTGVE